MFFPLIALFHGNDPERKILYRQTDKNQNCACFTFLSRIDFDTKNAVFGIFKASIPSFMGADANFRRH